MRYIKKPLIRVINIIVLGVFLLSGPVYPSNLRVPMDKTTQRLLKVLKEAHTQHNTLKEVLLIRHNLLRFLEPIEVLAYLETVETVPYIDPGITMSKDDALQLIKEGKASIARRVENGERVVVLFSPTDVVPKTDFIDYNKVIAEYKKPRKKRKSISDELEKQVELLEGLRQTGMYGTRGMYSKTKKPSIRELIEMIKNPESFKKVPAILAALELEYEWLSKRATKGKYTTRALVAKDIEAWIDSRQVFNSFNVRYKGRTETPFYRALLNFGFNVPSKLSTDRLLLKEAQAAI